MFRKPIRANGKAARQVETAAVMRSPPRRSSWLSAAAFAARSAVERVQTRADAFGSSDALSVNPLHDFFDLGLLDREVRDVEAVDDLLDRRRRGERAAVD